MEEYKIYFKMLQHTQQSVPFNKSLLSQQCRDEGDIGYSLMGWRCGWKQC